MTHEFYEYLLNVKGYSVRTVMSYRNDITAFVAWAHTERRGARWSTLTKSDIEAFIADNAKAGKAPASTNRYLASISALYKWMQTQGYQVENPCRYTSRRKVGETLPNTIDTQELRAAYEHSQGMVHIMLGLLYVTGCRIQELLDLRWEDINFKTWAVRLHGKGQKDRIVFATEETLAELDTIRERGNCEGRLFWIDQRTARRMIYDALKAHCHAKQLSPHAIRHTVATQMAANGANVVTIAKLLGHEHIETTQKYIDLAKATDLRAAQRAYIKFN